MVTDQSCLFFKSQLVIGHCPSVQFPHREVCSCVASLSPSENLVIFYKNGQLREEIGQERWNFNKEMKSGKAGSGVWAKHKWNYRINSWRGDVDTVTVQDSARADAETQRRQQTGDTGERILTKRRKSPRGSDTGTKRHINSTLGGVSQLKARRIKC